MDRYEPKQIEEKWQRVWEDTRAFYTPNPPAGEEPENHWYQLEMLPYPSGTLHMGHVLNYTMGDVLTHFRRRQGWMVMRPMGWDAFGLPAENAAIREGGHPKEIVERNIKEIRAQMRRIGIEPGQSFDITKLDPAVAKALEGVPAEASKLMEWKMATLARVANNWSMNTDTMGVYGNYYLKRAIVAQVGLGANLPEDAIYPLNLGDEKGNPLNGANSYTIHFDKASLPPVKAFWSITLYDPQGFQVANSINRFAVSSWMPFEYNADGSLDIHFQEKSPGKDKEANWLPAPAGPFNLTMRLYGPEMDALTGKWNPPPVVMVPVLQQVIAQ